jgi:pyruvate kinase
MLSGESAMGDYPVESVTMLAKIAAAVEPERHQIPVREMFLGVDLSGKIKPEHLIAVSVEASLEHVTPGAVFVPTRTGATARSIGRFRLPVWIIAVSSQETTCQNLQFSFGVCPVHDKDHPDQWKPYVKEWLQRQGIPGDIVVLREGPSTKHPDANHRIEIIDLRSSEI